MSETPAEAKFDEPTGPELQFALWRAEPPKPPLLSQRIRRLPWTPIWQGSLWILVLALAEIVTVRLGVSGVLNALGGTYVSRAFLLRMSRAPHGVLELMDFPEDVPQYPVRITVTVNGLPMGTDVGVVTFSGDLVYFEGRKTSFELSNRVASPERSTTPVGSTSFKSQMSGDTKLKWALDHEYGVLTISPYHKISSKSKDYAIPFRAAIWKWSVENRSDHRSLTLPPINPSSGSIRRAPWVAGSVGVLLAGVVSTIVLLLRSAPGDDSIDVAVGFSATIFLIVPFLVMQVDRVRAVRRANMDWQSRHAIAEREAAESSERPLSGLQSAFPINKVDESQGDAPPIQRSL